MVRGPNGRLDSNSSGYRIGPAEIEDCLIKHPAVAMAAVIGVPDEVRGEIVKAFILPHSDIHPDTKLAEEIKQFVKDAVGCTRISTRAGLRRRVAHNGHRQDQKERFTNPRTEEKGF